MNVKTAESYEAAKRICGPRCWEPIQHCKGYRSERICRGVLSREWNRNRAGYRDDQLFVIYYDKNTNLFYPLAAHQPRV